MSLKENLLFPCPKQTPDIRMLLDRVLEPDTASPLVRDLLDCMRSNRFGEAHFLLESIKRTLNLSPADMQLELAPLLFANAIHSGFPFLGFQYLIDSGFLVEPVATELLEYVVVGLYFRELPKVLPVANWLIDNGGIIVPESKAAWRALESFYPQAFSKNNSQYELRKLESYISSQSLEVREVTRL